MKKLHDFDSYWVHRLKDKALAAEYLNVALEDGNHKVFLIALREVTEAQGGFMKLAKMTGLDRSNLYKMLSTKGHPEIRTLEKVLAAFGLQIRVALKTARHVKKAA